MTRQASGEFQIPLVLSSGHQTGKLEYVVRPARRTGQSRFQERLEFEPRFDLGRYECKAAFDWIWIEIRTGRTTQSKHLHDRLKEVIGREIFVTGSDKDHDVPRPFNCTGNEFRLKLQDPKPAEMREILGAIDCRYGLAGEAKVLGIEVAIDFYPAPSVREAEVDADRYRMVAVLQRHHLADWDLFSGPRDDMRQTFGSMLQNRTDETRFVVPDPARPLGGGRTLSDCEARDPDVRNRHLQLHDDPLLVDATTYRGERGAPVSYRVQNKVRDGSSQDQESRKLLPLREQRARVEVTLLREGVRATGIETVGDLFDFNFVDLRNRLFATYLPTAPGVRRDVPDLLTVVDAERLRFARGAFIHGGCYAMVLQEKARLRGRAELRTQRRRQDPNLPAIDRIRLGKKGHLIEWECMNKRISKALRRLTDKWRGTPVC